MEIYIPDLVVQKDSTVSSVYEDGHHLQKDSSSPSQLGIDLESTNRNKSPVTVQEWVDSLPLISECGSREECDTTVPENPNPNCDVETDMFTLGAEAGHLVARKTSISSPVNVTITSCQEPSEVDSHCSSVDSLLEARKPDPEEILLSLGFGGTASSNYLETGRVPKRFLSPSQLKGVDIEEFIRQQQDLIYTFESGFYGYRGLAGPSHSNPSVIVAKILEKLREHEKESAFINSYHLDLRKRCSVDQNMIEKQPTKFSKVARNVLTKIRCTPGSVLSPDNRRWLDNQGKKSPEIARRLILGQQSFTFGHDGDLIESFDVRKSDSNENLDTDTDFKCNCQNVEESVGLEASSHSESFAQNKNKNTNDRESGRFPTETGTDTDLSIQSTILPSSIVGTVDETNKNTISEKSTSRFQSNDRRYSFARSRVPATDTNLTNWNDNSSENDKQEKSIHSSITTNEILSLHDEISRSRENAYVDVYENAGNVLSRSNSCEERAKDSSEEFAKKIKRDESQYSENMNEFSDSATESEFATYPSRTFPNKNIHKEYEEFILLESKIEHSGRLSKSITREQFLSLTTEQRTSLQSRVIREALEVYLNQLKEDDINIELKNCLSNEVRKVFDLVDGSSDSSKLAIIVRQMTLLLQQQSRLSAQIKELNVVDTKPSSCNKICDHLLKRVQELELLVQQNAQELAQMKNQLLSKK